MGTDVFKEQVRTITPSHYSRGNAIAARVLVRRKAVLLEKEEMLASALDVALKFPAVVLSNNQACW